MVGCYLNLLLQEFMQIIASYLLQMGCFKIYKASITPSDILLLIVWPELDIWKDWFGPQVGQVNDLVTTSAINLLFYLQKVIL